MSLPAKRPLSADEAARINASTPAEFSDYFGPMTEGIPAIEGPVHLPALEQESGCLILGDLQVDGLLVNPEYMSLIVTGSLRAGALLTMGKIVVLGDMVVGDVYGNSFSNQVCVVKGNLTTRCMVEKGHFFQALGSMTGEAVLSLSNVITARGGVSARVTALNGMKDEERQKVLDASLFDDSGSLSERLVVARLRAGRPLLAGA